MAPKQEQLKVIKLLLVHVFYELSNLTDNIAHYNRISFSFTLRHAYQLKSMYDSDSGDSEKRGRSVDGNYYIVLATTTIAFQLPR